MCDQASTIQYYCSKRNQWLVTNDCKWILGTFFYSRKPASGQPCHCLLKQLTSKINQLVAVLKNGGVRCIKKGWIARYFSYGTQLFVHINLLCSSTDCVERWGSSLEVIGSTLGSIFVFSPQVFPSLPPKTHFPSFFCWALATRSVLCSNCSTYCQISLTR